MAATSLALVNHSSRLSFSFSGILLTVSCLRAQLFRQRSCTRHIRRLYYQRQFKCRCLRARDVRRILDDQFLGHDGARPPVRERLHGRRPTLDRPLAHFLGHHECIHGSLRHRSFAWFLSLGLRVATPQHRRSQSPDVVWLALAHWSKLRSFDSVGSSQYHSIPVGLRLCEWFQRPTTMCMTYRFY